MSPAQKPVEAEWMAPIQTLPIELIHKIYHECDSVQDLLALTSSCYRLYCAWVGADQTKILLPIVRLQYSPLRDAIQLVAFMEELENVDLNIVMFDSESRRALFSKVSSPQHPYMTGTLLKKIVRVGSVASAWAEVYPQERWRENSEWRRLLNQRELHRVRRAIYRRWLYDIAFHNPSAMGFFYGTTLPQRDFFNQFPTRELLEMAELDDTLRRWIANDICPSDNMIRVRFEQGLPEQTGNHHVGLRCYFPGTCPCCTGLEKPVPITIPKKILDEGWGDTSVSLRAVRDVLKLPPNDLLYLRNNTTRKSERVEFLRNKGPWFHTEPSSFIKSMVTVPRLRWLGSCVYNRPSHLDGGIIDSADHSYASWNGETNDPPVDFSPMSVNLPAETVERE